MHTSRETHQLLPKLEQRFALSTLSTTIQLGCVALGLVSGASHAAHIEVTSHLDDGTACTLRDAIESINTPASAAFVGCINTGAGFGTDDTIAFSSSLTSNTITLANSQLALGRFFNLPSVVVTIDADNIAGGIHINAAGNSRVIYASYTELNMRNITLTGGVSDGPNDIEKTGGGLSAKSSTVTLSNSSVSGNFANKNGGGVSLSNGSVLILNESEISNNSAAFNAGGINGYYGSTITLNSSQLSNNSAANAVGGINVASSTLTLNSSSLLANSGGIISSGGISARGDSRVVLNDSAVSNSHGVGITSAGGASNTLSLNRSQVLGNISFAGADGGGIVGFSDLRLTDSVVSGNVSIGGGGGIAGIVDSATLINSIVSNNTAGNLGGGIEAFGGGDVF